MATYGALPTAGLVDTLKEGQRLTVMGYGVSGFDRGGDGPLPQPQAVFTGERSRATVRLLTPLNPAVGDQLVKTSGISIGGNGEGACRGIRAGRCSGPTRGPSWALPQHMQLPSCAGDPLTTSGWTYRGS